MLHSKIKHFNGWTDTELKFSLIYELSVKNAFRPMSQTVPPSYIYQSFSYMTRNLMTYILKEHFN
jgi:hypothetical protein